MAKFEKSTDNRPGLPDYYFECPGCKCQHGVWTSSANGNHATWSFNGDVDKPTIAPSIKITYPVGDSIIPHVCHSFIKDGFIQFLGDCTHELANRTVPLPEV